MPKSICIACISVFLFTSQISFAQVDISAGINIAYPELLTISKIINSGQISSGIHVAAAWRPEELQFFPGITIAYGGTRLPLQNAGNNVAALNLRYLDAMLNEYYAVDHANRLLLYGGIGMSYMNSKGAAPSGNNTMQTSIDSTANITHVFPAMNIGMEYAAYNGEKWHLSIGLCIRYSLLFAGKNDYYITVSEPGNKAYEYASSLSGNLITPGLYVALHYKIDKSN